MLEELALDPLLIVKLHPIPRTHRLRRLHAPQWRRSSIENWLESDNLEKVQLLNVAWTNEGAIVNKNTASESVVISKEEMDALLARAKARRIDLEGTDAAFDPYHALKSE
ncbi:hypothetical protein FRC17_008144 [Serendipita sp. 399]|nr:hypothetical protein FRC17_008144 [Serendipita sp. 399]